MVDDHPHGREEVKLLLSGQMLILPWTAIAKHSPIYALMLLVWFSKPEVRNNIGFCLTLAIAIISSVQAAFYRMALWGGCTPIRYGLDRIVQIAHRADFHPVNHRNGLGYFGVNSWQTGPENSREVYCACLGKQIANQCSALYQECFTET